MLVNIIKKYGVVPKSVMPETEASSNSRPMNQILTAKLREYAKMLRDMHERGASVDDLRQAKVKALEEFYRMLCIYLGKPPEKFFWEWRDKNDQFHREGEITPQKFYEKYVGLDLDEMICLINAPTKDKPYNRLYTVQYLGNVVGGQIIRYLNTVIDVLKEAAASMIMDNRAVWFGCDVGKMLERNLGIMDTEVYNYPLVFGTKLKLDKAGRLDYGHSRMTHAMVFTGVDIDDDGKPVKWRVENSWGTKIGDKGYMIMTDKWFDEYLYEITVSKKYLPSELLDVLETEPIVLPPWDPMGALALGI